MGKVWKATLLDQGTSRPLRAIKTVKEESPSHRAALEREITMLQTLARPDYFPVVHESFVVDDQLYMVMDWVEGRTLNALLDDVLAIDRARLLRIIEQVVDRLAYLHTWQPRPIVFRDLKPSNVMLDHHSDHLRLVDFGISHAVNPAADQIGAHTPGWVAPEVFKGVVTPATDLYALGRLVLSLLFGHVSPEKLRPDTPIPHGPSRGLPQAMVGVARAMMSPNPARRPSTAVAALISLREALGTGDEDPVPLADGTVRCACGATVPPRHSFCARCGNVRNTSKNRITPHARKPVEDMVVPASGAGPAPPWQQRALFDLLRVRSAADLSTLRCLPSIDVQPYGYQRAAAVKVLAEFQGRALIADDVGLGKTIEAGLIIKEYLVRQMAHRVLIVCPPGLLLSQMQEEMKEKFRLEFMEYRGSLGERDGVRIGPHQLEDHNLVIVSLHTFRRQKNLERFMAQSWDLLVVDECHHIKNHTSRSHKAVRALTTRYAVYMSATPFSGKLKELWAVYSALRPGWLGADYRTFRNAYLDSQDNVKDALKSTLGGITIRRQRKSILVKFPGRQARRVVVAKPARFQRIYQSLAAAATEHGRGYLDRTTLLQQVCSSYESLKDNVFWRRVPGGLPRELRSLTDADHPKARWFVDRVVPRVPTSEKVLVFTRFTKSQSALARLLREQGHKAEALREHTGSRRHKLLHDFLNQGTGVRFLVCGEGAGEGLNLQKASLLINFDLPWNPMKVEQRIGRVQRLGQRRSKVTVVNVIMRNTVEEQVLDVMQKKLEVFNNLLGDTEQILGEIFNHDAEGSQTSFEHWLASALLPQGRLSQPILDSLAQKIEAARREVALSSASHRDLDRIFDEDDDAMDGVPSPDQPPLELGDEGLFDD